MFFFLLSYPRSGNTWTRYLIEYFSNRPTTSCPTMRYPERWGVGPKDTLGLCESVHLPNVKGKDYIVVKKHKMFDSEKDTLPMIFLLRNYKEVLIRHFGSRDAAEAHLRHKDQNTVNYFKCISDYDNWRENKIILYYEDIVFQPKEAIEKLTKFIGCYNKKKIEEFLSNIEYHRNNSLDSYGKITLGGRDASQSRGKSKIFHSQGMSIEEKKKWDNIILENTPVLFHRYLKRYAEHE